MATNTTTPSATGTPTSIPTPTNLHKECRQVSDLCPVKATVLGYYPNLGSGYFFSVAFGILFLAAITIGVLRRRTWSYTVALACGLGLEMAGYVGRVLLGRNPWDQRAFELQICAIIIGPTFICAAVYLTLKHVALALDPSLSRIRPAHYPLIFLPADISCLIVQAIGGGIVASAGAENPGLQRGGDHAIIAGVCLQVFVLVIFGALGLDYLLRVARRMRLPEARETQGFRIWRATNFRFFLFAICTAYILILIRCVYRIAEMAGGWGNHIMQDQPSFLVLDSTLILVGGALLTVFHPGLFFPQMGNNNAAAPENPTKAERCLT